MTLPRITRHLLTTRWQLRRSFTTATLAAIEAAIGESERQQSGQVRFAVETALHAGRLLRQQNPRQRALEVFSGLRMWDTEHRNGVLIYLLLADRAVEIVVDRGAHLRIDSQVWTQICGRMEDEFRAGRYRDGVLEGIRAVTAALRGPFPPAAMPSHELPDTPVVI